MVELREAEAAAAAAAATSVGRRFGFIELWSPHFLARQTRGGVLYQKENAPQARLRDSLAGTPAAVTHSPKLGKFLIYQKKMATSCVLLAMKWFGHCFCPIAGGKI